MGQEQNYSLNIRKEETKCNYFQMLQLSTKGNPRYSTKKFSGLIREFSRMEK